MPSANSLTDTYKPGSQYTDPAQRLLSAAFRCSSTGVVRPGILGCCIWRFKRLFVSITTVDHYKPLWMGCCLH